MKALFLYIAFCFVMPLLAVGHPAAMNRQQNGILFVQNKGQVTDQYHQPRKDIDFRIKVPGMSIFIGKGRIQYQWAKVETLTAVDGNQQSYASFQRLDVALVGANPNAELIAAEAQPYYETYYLPQCMKGVVANSYRKVIYKNVYPGIDWVLYTIPSSGTLKYDFIVHKGANIADIKIVYAGADSIKLAEGALIAFTHFGSIREQAPYTYNALTAEPVHSRFIIKENIVQFEVIGINDNVVIDPAINWGTYFGGEGNDMSSEVRTDKAGNIYVTGNTASDHNIATVGAYQVARINIFRDGYLLKLKQDGTAAWATYFGGDYDDEIMAAAIDASGYIYLGGVTQSSGMATAGVHQISIGGYKDGLIAKFSPSGNLDWSTYFGGSGYDSVVSIAVNGSDLYVGGRSSSASGIATMGNALSDNEDAFLAKFNAGDGTRIWGFYHLGYHIAAIVCNSTHVYVAGVSYSSLGISTPGSHQPVYGGNGLSDGFLGKYKTDGTVEWSTYYGGGGNDGINAMTMDGAGNIYIAGQAFSNTAIATNTAYQTTLSGSEDAFVAKFNSSGVRQWGTYYGGQYQDGAYGIALDGSGNIYITGETLSPSKISTAISHQYAFGGGANDAFIAQFSKDGTQLKWGSYYGGKSDDDGRSIAYDIVNKALYVCGVTKSDTSIATSSGYQPVYNQLGDGFVAAFTADSPYVYIDTAFADTVFCAGDTFNVGYVAVEMQVGNKITVELSDANGSFASPVAIGTQNSITSGIVKCRIPPGTKAGAGYRIRVASSNPIRVSGDNGNNIRVDKFPTAPKATSNSPVCEGDTMKLDIEDVPSSGMNIHWSGPGFINPGIKNPVIDSPVLADSGDYYLEMYYGQCSLYDTIHVSVNPNPPAISFTSNSPICENGTLVLTQTDTITSVIPYSIKWYGPAGFSDTVKNPQLLSVTLENAGVYTLRTIAGNCITETISNVVINPAPKIPEITSNSPVSVGQELKIDAKSETPGVSYSWTGPDSFYSNQQNIVISPVSSLAAGKYTVEVSLGDCKVSSFILVNINNSGRLVIGPNPTTGTFTINGSFKSEQTIPLRIVNMYGRVFYETKVNTTKKLLNATITLPDSLPNGDYILQLYADKEFKGYAFVLLK